VREVEKLIILSELNEESRTLRSEINRILVVSRDACLIPLLNLFLNFKKIKTENLFV